MKQIHKLSQKPLPEQTHTIPDNLSHYAILYNNPEKPGTRYQRIDLYFDLPQELIKYAEQGESLAIFTGDITDVSALYIDEIRLGGNGSLKPYQPGAMRPLLYTIAPEKINTKGQPVFRLRLSTIDYNFPLQIMQPFYVGRADAVYRQVLMHELSTVTFLAIYLMVACYHLFLFWKRPQDKYYLHFALFALIVSCYWFVSDTAIRDLVFQDRVYLHRKVEHILLFFILPPFFFFMTRFFKHSYAWLSKIFLGLAIILSAMTIIGDMHWMRIAARVWHASYLFCAPTFIYYLIRELLRGNRDAIYLAIGLTVLTLAGVNDVLRSLTIVQTPRLANYSLFIFVIGLVGLMANRFVDATNHAERLLAHTTRLNLELIQKNIHPHFLMNSINSAINLVAEDPPKAEQLLLSLASEIHETLKASQQEFTMLEREIDLIKRHLDVIALRYEKKIHLRVHGEPGELIVPPLILLTLIENGLTHGLRGRESIEFILNINREKHRLLLTIFNDGNNETQESRGTGTGLRYVESRLSEAFGNDWQLEHAALPEGYQVKLQMPLSLRGMRDPGFRSLVTDFAKSEDRQN